VISSAAGERDDPPRQFFNDTPVRTEIERSGLPDLNRWHHPEIREPAFYKTAAGGLVGWPIYH